MSSDDDVIEEIEALEAILMEGIEVERSSESSRPLSVTCALSPLTASNSEKKYVSLSLKLKLSKTYPEVSPEMSFIHPRGLEESKLSLLHSQMKLKCEDFLGEPVLYELVEMVREFLTRENVPACPCVICCNRILGNDSFIKTECYHYFHSLCYGRFIESEKNECSTEGNEIIIRCPICREPLLTNPHDSYVKELLGSPTPMADFLESSNHSMRSELQDLQVKMREIYERQKEKGAIIDVEADEKKFLVATNYEDLPPQLQQRRKNEVRKNIVDRSTESLSSEVVVIETSEPRTGRRNKNFRQHNISRHQRHKINKKDF